MVDSEFVCFCPVAYGQFCIGPVYLECLDLCSFLLDLSALLIEGKRMMSQGCLDSLNVVVAVESQNHLI